MAISDELKDLFETKPIDIPLSVKTISALKERFNMPEIYWDKLQRYLKKDGAEAEQMRLFVSCNMREHITACRHCSLPLYENHTQKVPGEGSLQSPMMLIGEGPGFDEDRDGRPFIGKAGQLLTTILDKLEVNRQRVYITNVIKCRPPENRTPLKSEIDACSKILELELDIIAPKVVIALGAVPLKYFKQDGGIIRSRGKWLQSKGIWIMPTYHPAYILRQQGKALVKAKWDVWHDFNAAFYKVKELCPDYRFK